MSKKIEITIDEDGKINAEAFGFKGTGCVDEIMYLLEGLGDPEKIIKKDEYFGDAKVMTESKTKIKRG